MLSQRTRRWMLSRSARSRSLARGPAPGRAGECSEEPVPLFADGRPPRTSDNLAAALQGLGERHLVRVLQVTTDGQAAGDARHADAQRPEQLGQIERGGLALHVGIGGQDDLGDAARLQPRQQLADLDVVGTDAIQRGEGSEEHVVTAAVFTGALHGQEVVGLLHHAEHAVVAPGVGADAAGVLVGDVEAGPTGHDALLDRHQRGRELAHLVHRPLEEKEGESLSRLRSDAGQALEGLDQSRHRLRIVGHLSPEAGDAEAAGQLAQLLLHHVARLAQGLVRGGQHEVLQHLDVVAADHLGVDLDRDQLLLAVGLHGDHPAPGGRLDLLLGCLGLDLFHLLLDLLRFLHDVAEALHGPPPSGERARMATISPWNSAIAACTAGCASGPASISPSMAMVKRSVPVIQRRTAWPRRSWACGSRSRSRWNWLPASTRVRTPRSMPAGRTCASTAPSSARLRVTSSITRCQASPASPGGPGEPGSSAASPSPGDALSEAGSSALAVALADSGESAASLDGSRPGGRAAPAWST